MSGRTLNDQHLQQAPIHLPSALDLKLMALDPALEVQNLKVVAPEVPKKKINTESNTNMQKLASGTSGIKFIAHIKVHFRSVFEISNADGKVISSNYHVLF